MTLTADALRKLQTTSALPPVQPDRAEPSRLDAASIEPDRKKSECDTAAPLECPQHDPSADDLPQDESPQDELVPVPDAADAQVSFRPILDVLEPNDGEETPEQNFYDSFDSGPSPDTSVLTAADDDPLVELVGDAMVDVPPVGSNKETFPAEASGLNEQSSKDETISLAASDGRSTGQYERCLLERLLDPDYQRPFGDLAERLRRLRLDEIPQSVLILSVSESLAGPELAAHLALCLVDDQESVTLVDANLADQRLTRCFDLQSRPGLCDLLEEQVPTSEAIQPSSQTRLKLVGTGDDHHGISRSADRASALNWDMMLQRFKRESSWTVIDGGAVGSTLARPLARRCMHVIVCVDAVRDSLESVRDAVQQLRAWEVIPTGLTVWTAR